MSPIFVEIIQQRCVLFSGSFYPSSFDEQDQFSLPRFLVLFSRDSNAARVIASFWHVEPVRSDSKVASPVRTPRLRLDPSTLGREGGPNEIMQSIPTSNNDTFCRSGVMKRANPQDNFCI